MLALHILLVSLLVWLILDILAEFVVHVEFV